MSEHDPIIVALDFENAAAANSLVAALGDEVSFYKVGLELYAAAGMYFVHELIGAGKNVFLDLKLYDIPETVRRAVWQVAQAGVRFLTVHARKPVMSAAVEGRDGSVLRLLAVTVLTSFDEADLREMGHTSSLGDLVALRVRHAVETGMDGIVASPLEARRVRSEAGNDMLIVTPGVRSQGAAVGDQKRVATPAQAIRDGADYLVIGRQVTRAKDPVQEVRAIRAEIEAVRA